MYAQLLTIPVGNKHCCSSTVGGREVNRAEHEKRTNDVEAASIFRCKVIAKRANG